MTRIFDSEAMVYYVGGRTGFAFSAADPEQADVAHHHDPDGIRLEVNHVPGKGVFAEEWRSTGEEIEEDRSDAVDVGRRRKAFRSPLHLFGRNVTGCTENRERPREIGRSVEPFRQTEIAHQRFATAIE